MAGRERRRREPLVLASTKALLDSAVSSSQRGGDGDDAPSHLSLSAGILRLKTNSEIGEPKLSSLDESALVGLSISVLKRLRVTSGSLVSVLFQLLRWFCLILVLIG